MFIKIDFANATTIYEQVVQQMKFAIAAGSIQTNEMIPSVRELAKQLTLNPNTIARAYRTLQDEGIVFSRRGTGLVVAEDSQHRCKTERRNWFETRFRKLYDEAVQSRLEPEEIKEIFKLPE